MAKQKHHKYGWFMPSETRCKCGCGGDITDDLRSELNAIRDDLGFAVYIVSGFRCADYNRKVGGAVGSYHMSGIAADIQLPHRRDRRHRLIAATYRRQRLRGRGFYKTFIHVDMREKHGYWIG